MCRLFLFVYVGFPYSSVAGKSLQRGSHFPGLFTKQVGGYAQALDTQKQSLCAERERALSTPVASSGAASWRFPWTT